MAKSTFVVKADPTFVSFKNNAIRWLKELRKSVLPGDYKLNREHFDRYIREGSLFLSDIGTDEGELELIQAKCYMKSVLSTMTFMKESPEPSASDSELRTKWLEEHFMRLDDIREDLKRGGITKEDVKTSQIYRKAARGYIKDILSGKLTPEQYDEKVSYLRRALFAGFPKARFGGRSWFSLEDFNLTEKRLSSLDPRNK